MGNTGHLIGHAALKVGEQLVKSGGGCMVTFLAYLTGLGAFVALAILILN